MDMFYWFGGFREGRSEEENIAHAHAQFAVRCRYYAFDTAIGRVLDLNGHMRHMNIPGMPDAPPVLHPHLSRSPVPHPRNRGTVYGNYHC